ncbi:hypothetical protein [Enterococcus casseliflavus]|uniref:hypothetical protein n=1 Tax=Enterococcus casseliflavus TaxID=37734 RepID=UPI001C9733D1|nr:hypothetical protein [Enterococcus casseliflavus]
MFTKLKKLSKETFLNYVTYSLIFVLITQICYEYLSQRINIQFFWMLVPLILFLMIEFIGRKINKIKISSILMSMVSISSLIIMFLNVNIVSFNLFLSNYFEVISFSIIILFLVNVIVQKRAVIENSFEFVVESPDKLLFNLFYINTSKVHEIVMLIDNKIMKTIESEQVSEELLKYSNSGSVGMNKKWNLETNHSHEENFKKRVYENFDVKTTKSIMLKKIYETIEKEEIGDNLKIGDLRVFKNIELEQENVDDTVMILNILQDSEMKNDPNESIQLNLNKMMSNLLNDFTIDYTFSYIDSRNSKAKYLIRIPYGDTENFENGYQHNDLQLGKLSLVGIYRGKIDFSKKENASSKFLELMAESYENNENNQSTYSMNNSKKIESTDDFQFHFKHKKLEDSLHLIDVIAIIQELNIDRKD